IINKSNLELPFSKTLPQSMQDTLENDKYFKKNYIDATTGEKYFVVGRQVFEDDTLIGNIVIYSSVGRIHNILHEVRFWILLSIISATLLALGYTIFISRKLSKPLLRMEEATRKIAKGDLNSKVSVTSTDEVGSLGQAINDLSIELNNYRTNRSELLANISHELRTPISFLKGYAELISKKMYRTESELVTFSSIIEKESERLAKLIQELFELSKMEEGQIHIQLQSIDLEDVIDDTIEKVSIKAQEKELIVNKSVESNLPHIISDGSKIQQILLNLLENAINYSNQGEIIVKARKLKEELEIRVFDSGVGIPSEDLPFIFDRFFRVEKSRARNLGGTGLGLAIVSELTKQLGGTINAKSSIDAGGTEFIMLFPINPQLNPNNNV
ncbi:sensor histidine kinase, partial [Terribacillus saccharophilus]|uniref:sensor histidine kinase n=1 Tax=Terribacillus saccharophilus TaxID=361277 RepID=UPI002DD2C757|nr:HAMP domain-containing sensor histidine kinase [Terribacillus saccharophilus]